MKYGTRLVYGIDPKALANMRHNSNLVNTSEFVLNAEHSNEGNNRSLDKL